MLRNIFSRSFHLCSCHSAVDKTMLAKLRKATGYSISNCKKALELNNNDCNSAEKWLQEMAKKEGWEKAMKLKDRTATQGLIGIHLHDNAASIVEVSCETDFVARNNYFKELVITVANAAYTTQFNMEPQTESYSIIKKSLLTSDLQKLQWKDTNLTDTVSVAVSQLGENIILRRAMTVMAGDGISLNAYCHPFLEGQPSTIYGKYGAIVAFRQNPSKPEVGLQLCQHVVGMNPSTIGNCDSEESENKEEETVMFHQEFLADPELTVGEFLANEEAEVIDFIRFSCGETNI